MTDTITIEGVRYSKSVFRGLGIAGIGHVFRIDARDDGVLTLTRLFEHEKE